jgi:hypothetical protein
MNFSRQFLMAAGTPLLAAQASSDYRAGRGYREGSIVLQSGDQFDNLQFRCSVAGLQRAGVFSV